MSQSDLAALVTAISIVVVILIVYIGYIVVSFFFMRRFVEKIENIKKTISVLIYQKYEGLDFVAESLIKEGVNNRKLKEFSSGNEFNKYTKITADEFEIDFDASEEAYNFIKGIFQDLKYCDSLDNIKNLMLSIDSINSKYYESIQLYNTYVVGYNYWRNLFFTKWVKKLFKKEEYDSIK